MNHDQDIDDGLDEYLETSTREHDETVFAGQPELFTRSLDPNGVGELFRCTRVHSLHLTGGKFETRDSPFAYDGGFADLEGSMWPEIWPVRVKLRWAGTSLDTTIERTR